VGERGSGRTGLRSPERGRQPGLQQPAARRGIAAARRAARLWRGACVSGCRARLVRPALAHACCVQGRLRPRLITLKRGQCGHCKQQVVASRLFRTLRWVQRVARRAARIEAVSWVGNKAPGSTARRLPRGLPALQTQAFDADWVAPSLGPGSQLPDDGGVFDVTQTPWAGPSAYTPPPSRARTGVPAAGPGPRVPQGGAGGAAAAAQGAAAPLRALAGASPVARGGAAAAQRTPGGAPAPAPGAAARPPALGAGLRAAIAAWPAGGPTDSLPGEPPRVAGPVRGASAAPRAPAGAHGQGWVHEAARAAPGQAARAAPEQADAGPLNWPAPGETGTWAAPDSAGAGRAAGGGEAQRATALQATPSGCRAPTPEVHVEAARRAPGSAPAAGAGLARRPAAEQQRRGAGAASVGQPRGMLARLVSPLEGARAGRAPPPPETRLDPAARGHVRDGLSMALTVAHGAARTHSSTLVVLRPTVCEQQRLQAASAIRARAEPCFDSQVVCDAAGQGSWRAGEQPCAAEPRAHAQAWSRSCGAAPPPAPRARRRPPRPRARPRRPPPAWTTLSHPQPPAWSTLSAPRQRRRCRRPWPQALQETLSLAQWPPRRPAPPMAPTRPPAAAARARRRRPGRSPSAGPGRARARRTAAASARPSADECPWSACRRAAPPPLSAVPALAVCAADGRL